MSDMREKLIEIICDGTLKTEICTTDTHIECETCKGDRGYCTILADHLISNGVRLETKQATETSDEKTSEWIPVSERLPEKMEWVMCACVDGEVIVLRYDHIMDDWDLLHRPNRCYKKEYVTHWMPLPEPPKGE